MIKNAESYQKTIILCSNYFQWILRDDHRSMAMMAAYFRRKKIRFMFGDLDPNIQDLDPKKKLNGCTHMVTCCTIGWLVGWLQQWKVRQGRRPGLRTNVLEQARYIWFKFGLRDGYRRVWNLYLPPRAMGGGGIRQRAHNDYLDTY